MHLLVNGLGQLCFYKEERRARFSLSRMANSSKPTMSGLWRPELNSAVPVPSGFNWIILLFKPLLERQDLSHCYTKHPILRARPALVFGLRVFALSRLRPWQVHYSPTKENRAGPGSTSFLTLQNFYQIVSLNYISRIWTININFNSFKQEYELKFQRLN